MLLVCEYSQTGCCVVSQHSLRKQTENASPFWLGVFCFTLSLVNTQGVCWSFSYTLRLHQKAQLAHLALPPLPQFERHLEVFTSSTHCDQKSFDRQAELTWNCTVKKRPLGRRNNMNWEDENKADAAFYSETSGQRHSPVLSCVMKRHISALISVSVAFMLSFRNSWLINSLFPMFPQLVASKLTEWITA